MKMIENAKKYMLDSNIFDQIVLEPLIANYIIVNHDDYCMTSVQNIELSRVHDQIKKEKIIDFIEKAKLPVCTTVLSFSFFSFEHSSFGGSEFVSEYIDGHETRLADALIADTALKSKYTLVSNDVRMHKRMRRLGYTVIDYESFKEEVLGRIN